MSCQKRVMESPPREQDALFSGEPSLQRSANYLFVFKTVRIRHHMYSYPSDEGLYSQFLCACDQLLDRHPRQERGLSAHGLSSARPLGQGGDGAQRFTF